jgi:hypothetical protein
MRRSLAVLKYSESEVRIWAGVHIFPTELGRGGAKRIDKRVEFPYYDFGVMRNEMSLTFKDIKEAQEFVQWYDYHRPDRRD